MVLIWGAFGLYWLFPFAEVQHTMDYGLEYSGAYNFDSFKLFSFNELNGLTLTPNFTFLVLFYLACLYSIVAIPVLLRKKGASKFQMVLNGIKNKEYGKKFKNTLLFFGVKYFFIPLMVPATISSLANVGALVLAPKAGMEQGWMIYFNMQIYPILVYLIMAIALGYYSFGYLIESERLNSKIKSVDSTVFGWVVALICYTPFYTLVNFVIPKWSHDFTYFINEQITFAVRLGLVLVGFFKIWSIATLGAKCSNLTNRGIVTHGPYRWVRHPHYLSKLIVWWVCFLPEMTQHWWTIGGMIFWSVIYVLRAQTEEQHLLSDPDYVAYKQDVKWRFVPFIY